MIDFILACCLVAPPPDVAVLTQSAASQSQSLHSWEFNIVLRMQDTGKDYFSCTWARDGKSGRERIRTNYKLVKDDNLGRPRGFNDALVKDTGEYRLLVDWDPKRPQSLSATEKGSCRGEIGVRTASAVVPGGYDPRRLFLWSAGTDDGSLDIAKLSSIASSVKAEADEVVQGASCKVVRIELPRDKSPKSSGWTYRFFIDPSSGYAIRKIWAQNSDIDGAKGENNRATNYSEVVDFYNPKPGLYIPKNIVICTDTGKMLAAQVECISANEAVPDTQFDFKFPDFCRVTNFTSGKLEIVNEKQEAIAAFANADEHNEWALINSPDRLAVGRSPRRIIVSLLVLGGLVLGLGWWVVRKRRTA